VRKLSKLAVVAGLVATMVGFSALPASAAGFYKKTLPYGYFEVTVTNQNDRIMLTTYVKDTTCDGFWPSLTARAYAPGGTFLTERTYYQNQGCNIGITQWTFLTAGDLKGNTSGYVEFKASNCNGSPGWGGCSGPTVIASSYFTVL
jgi:hypothetical protein